MLDSATNKPVRVSAQDEERPYIVVSVQQLDNVRQLLDTNSVRYWVDHQQVSVNNGPLMSFLYLRRGTDHRHVQALLDAA